MNVAEIIWGLALVSLTSFMQTNDGVNDHSDGIARVVYIQDVSRLSNEELSDALKKLRAQTKKLETEITQDRGPTGSTEPLGSGSRSKVPAIDSNTSSDQSIAEKVKDIESNIKVLQQLYAEKNRRKLADAKQQAASMIAEQNKNQSLIPDPSKDPQNFSQFAGSGNDSANSMNSNTVALPKKVVSTIVDPFELGNSLFLSGNTEQAIKFYQLVAEDQLSDHDRHWLYLMRACCERANGNIEEAETIYRSVANVKNGKRAAGAAKGWLKYIASRKQIDALVEEYGNKADVVLKQAEIVKESIGGSSN